MLLIPGMIKNDITKVIVVLMGKACNFILNGQIPTLSVSDVLEGVRLLSINFSDRNVCPVMIVLSFVQIVTSVRYDYMLSRDGYI